MRFIEKLYFVASEDSAENEVISKIKPEYLLLSYFYFKNKDLEEWCNKIGYKPKILLDSGAYSAFTKKKNIALIDYISYINKNIKHIDKYISLDVIGDGEFTYWYYKVMKIKKLNPIPVFHYGDNEMWLQKYIYEEKEDYIALGATVPEKNKNKVAEWINELIEKYPNIKFHLLGSSSKKITGGCPKLYSSDSSTWIMMALNGYPKDIKGRTREAKIERATYWMEELNKLNYKA